MSFLDKIADLDPVTAGLIVGAFPALIGGVGPYLGLRSQKQSEQEQDRLIAEQEKSRQESIRREVGIMQQRTQTALAGAGPKAPSTPSFAGSVLSGLPSYKNQMGGAPGTSGTF